MPTPNPIHSAMSNISSNDVHIDALGRAVITNPDIVSNLAKAGVNGRPDLTHAAGNIICTGSMPTGSKEMLGSLRTNS